MGRDEMEGVRVKWEYCQANHNGKAAVVFQSGNGPIIDRDKSFIDLFNRLGDQGWEMCGINTSENDVTFYYFKRPNKKANDEELEKIWSDAIKRAKIANE